MAPARHVISLTRQVMVSTRQPMAWTRHVMTSASQLNASTSHVNALTRYTRASVAMIQPDMKRMPALIARCRREVNCDQQSLANAVEVSLRTLSRWENGKHWPSPPQARDLAYALQKASNETWTALVDALKLPLDELLEECPHQKTAEDGSHARKKNGNKEEKAPTTAAIVPIEPAAPVQSVPVTPVIDMQGTVDDLIRAYAEEADMSPRRLRLVLGLLLGELDLMGVDLQEGRALVMHTRRRLR
jgi:DNA-binding transcriptional regulator YiaG